MNAILTTIALSLATSGIAISGLSLLLHRGMKRVETAVSKTLPEPIAEPINEVLDIIDRLAETAVQDSNSRIVVGLKQNNLFTKETAESIKQAVVNDVLNNMGPLKDKAAELVGPVERIVEQAVEKFVFQNKQQVNGFVQQTQQTPA